MRYFITTLFFIPAIAHAQIRVSELQNLLNPLPAESLSAESLFGKILNLLITIAAILALVYLIWAGIQFIIASGDPEKAKKARDAIFHAIIGIIIIILSYTIIAWTRSLIEEGLSGDFGGVNQQGQQQAVRQQLTGLIPNTGDTSGATNSQLSQPGPLITSGFTNVAYSANGFSPNNIRIQAGTIVTFKNSGTSTAELLSYPGNNNLPELNIGTLNQDRQVLLQRKGTWRYYNPSNPNHQGVITVE